MLANSLKGSRFWCNSENLTRAPQAQEIISLLGWNGAVLSDADYMDSEEFEHQFQKLIEAMSLSTAFDMAEECLSLLPDKKAFRLRPESTKHHGIQIDPVYTLLDRLIALKEAKRADILSTRYMELLRQEEEKEKSDPATEQISQPDGSPG